VIFDILQAKARMRVLVLVYLFCLVSFVGLGGYWGSQWQFERRGIESFTYGAPDRRMGVNVELTQYTAAELNAVLDDLATLSFYWLRVQLSWREMEPQPGEYKWAAWDAIIPAVNRHGLGMVVVLDDPPEWALRQRVYPLPCVPPIDETAYARFVTAVAARYGEWIDHYQIWDEPNLSRRWANSHVAACGYVTLLQAAYPAIHAADPSAWVLGGALAPTQAPGPDNLNDLTYLRRLYALGGEAWFDILAVKPYGFWSGPDDRRVEPDVLNFSRTIALREIMRAHGDQTTPVWAVEWGWNVLPDGYTGTAMPWGGDRADVQMQRIRDAIARARSEWPWLGPLIWAEYQPALPVDAPRWSFALRDAQNNKTKIYELFRSDVNRGVGTRPPSLWPMFGTMLVGVAFFSLPWFLPRWRQAAREVWHALAALPPGLHLAWLVVLAGWYALASRLEWALVAWLLALPILYLHPDWALSGAVVALPFHYWAKPFGDLRIAPAEPLLGAALIVQVGHSIRTRLERWARKEGHPFRPSCSGLPRSMLDVTWLLWSLIGTAALGYAVDPAAAWHEWRLSIIEPTLLYVLIRISRKQDDKILGTWFVSALLVATIGLGQWALGRWIPAGAVGRVCGPFFSPNHLALYLERALIPALVIALCAPTRRLWRWSALLIMGAALYLTYSRGAWLLALPAALIAVARLCRQHFKKWMLTVSVIGLGVIGLVLLDGRAPGSLRQEIRLPVWQSTLQMIVDHPWGVGPDGFQFIYPRYMRPEAWTEPLLYHPHNMWLDAAARLGIHGLLAFMGLVGAMLLRTIRIVKNSSATQKAINIGLLASMIAALAHGMVDSGYFLPDLAWSTAIVAGLVAERGEQ